MLFFARDAEHGNAPWVGNGSPDGTTLLMNINEGAIGSVGS